MVDAGIRLDGRTVVVPASVSGLSRDVALEYDGDILTFSGNADGFTIAKQAPYGYLKERRDNATAVVWSFYAPAAHDVEVPADLRTIHIDGAAFALDDSLVTACEVVGVGYAVLTARPDCRNVYLFNKSGDRQWQVAPRTFHPEWPYITLSSPSPNILTARIEHGSKEYTLNPKTGAIESETPSW